MATTTKSATNGPAKQRPVFAKSYFPVQVAVFERSHDGRRNHSVKLTRTFRHDEESEWETTEFLFSGPRIYSRRHDFSARRMRQSLRDRTKPIVNERTDRTQLRVNSSDIHPGQSSHR